jgi:hypothetical protein
MPSGRKATGQRYMLHILFIRCICWGWLTWDRMGSLGERGGPSTDVWLFPTTSMTIMGEKLGVDPWIGQPSRCGSGREPFFLGAVDLFNSVDNYAKGCYAQTVWDTYGREPYEDRVWATCGMLVSFPLQGVCQFESPWLLDMSNRLSCGHQLLDNLMTLMVVYDEMVIINYLFANSYLISLDGSFR